MLLASVETCLEYEALSQSPPFHPAAALEASMKHFALKMSVHLYVTSLAFIRSCFLLHDVAPPREFLC